MSASSRRRSDLPPIVASWPSQNVWILGHGTHYSGLPSLSRWVSIALPPLRKDRTTLSEIEAGQTPEYIAFGRATRTTGKFHAHLKSPLTEFSTVGLVPPVGKTIADVLVFQRPDGSQVAISVGSTRAAQLLGVQVREIWEYATRAHRNWQEHLGPKGLMELSPTAFERLVTSIFQSVGAEARHTGSTGDGGVDAEFVYANQLFVVQCKRFKTPVGPGHVRELLGVTVLRQAKLGILVSTSGYTPAARQSAEGQPIRLLGPNQLAALDASIFDTRGDAEPPQLEIAFNSVSRAPWPTPERARLQIQLSSSPATPQFIQLPVARRSEIVVRGALSGFLTWSVVIIGLVIWAVFWKGGLIPVALLPFVVGISVVWGIRARQAAETQRGPTCVGCKHQSRNHRLKVFSPHRMRLTCDACMNCDHLLPDPEASSVGQPQTAKPLVYVVVTPSDGNTASSRALVDRTNGPRGATQWLRFGDFPLSYGHAFITDPGGTQGRSRYRYHFSRPADPHKPTGVPLVRNPADPHKPTGVPLVRNGESLSSGRDENHDAEIPKVETAGEWELRMYGSKPTRMRDNRRRRR